jgi:hypothetical protein
MYDLGNRILATLHMPTENDQQLQARQELLKTVIPHVFDGLEHRLQPSGYVVGSDSNSSNGSGSSSSNSTCCAVAAPAHSLLVAVY